MRKLFYAIMLLVAFHTYGQNLKLDNVLQVKLKNTGVVSTEDNQVKGYYYFYDVEKVDKKNNNYILKVTDENLREINSINITKPKTSYLVEAEYNGEAFAFLFYNTKEKSIELVSYDKSLKQIGTISKLLKGNYNTMLFNQALQGVESGIQFLVGVKNKGFMYYGFVETKKYHYSVDFYDNNMKKVWNTTTDPESKEMIFAEPAFQTEEIVGSTISRKKGIFSKDFDYDLLVNDLKTGKQLFKMEIKDPGFNLSATKVTYDESTKNVMVFGEYFDLTDKEAKSLALGYFSLLIDLNGKITQKKFVSWGKDLNKFGVANKDGKMEKGGRIFVHEILRTADGDIFVIGEQYKKAASGAGIAMAVLSGGRGGVSTAQVAILNMVILHFGPSFEAKGIEVFEKDKNTYLLPSGSEFMSPKMLSYYAQSNGWFDYNFYQVMKDKNTFMVTFNNYIKEKGEKGQNVLSAVIYTPEKVFTKDKVTLDRKSSECLVQRAKSGYVMVTEYYKKEKHLETRLEKINY